VSHPDPYPYYAQLVAERPFYYDEALRSWVASSAEAVTEVLASDRCGVRPLAEPVPTTLIGSEAGEVFRRFIRMNDAAGRQHLKRALAAAIGSIDESRVIDKADEYARLLCRSGGRPSTIASRLPACVVADLLGVPVERVSYVSELIDDFVRCLAAGSDANVLDRGKAAAKRLSHYFRSLLADLDVQKSDSLMAVVSRELKRAGCEDDDMAVANAIGFMFQTYEATAALILISLLALSIRADMRESVAVDHDRLRSFVAETIRFDSPVQNTRRYVNQAGEIAGHHVQAGDAVLVLLAAANRDPSANARAERFEIDRTNRRVFTFGLGSHACPGESLATTIAVQGIAGVMRSGLDLASLAIAVRYRPSPNVRMPEFA
jgi:cytochrome P450